MKNRKLIPILIISVIFPLLFITQTPMMFSVLPEGGGGGGGGSSINWSNNGYWTSGGLAFTSSSTLTPHTSSPDYVDVYSVITIKVTSGKWWATAQRLAIDGWYLYQFYLNGYSDVMNTCFVYYWFDNAPMIGRQCAGNPSTNYYFGNTHLTDVTFYTVGTSYESTPFVYYTLIYRPLHGATDIADGYYHFEQGISVQKPSTYTSPSVVSANSPNFYAM